MKPLWAMRPSSSSPAVFDAAGRVLSPVPGYGVTTPWGKRPKDGTYWRARGHHTGDDYADADGSGTVDDAEVVAVLSGQAVLGVWDAALGNVVLLFADNGFTYWYCHLSQRNPGRRVEAGDVLGHVGHTGTGARGPHLHLEKRAGHSRSWSGTDLRPSW